MHAKACVYEFVDRFLSIFTRLQIQYSIFDIRYSIFDIQYSTFDIRYSIPHEDMMHHVSTFLILIFNNRNSRLHGSFGLPNL